MPLINNLPAPPAEFDKGGGYKPGQVSSVLSSLPAPPKDYDNGGGYKPSEGSGASPDTPAQKSIMGDLERSSASFGNDSGIGKMMVSKGYLDAKRNKDGELVFKHSDGKWYKDADNFFKKDSWVPEHPVNYLESSVGKSLPLMGMTAGAMAAAPGLATAVPGAAAGAAGGEGLRQLTGRYLGTYDGGALDSAADTGKEMASAAGAEVIGAGANKVLGPVVKDTVGYLGPKIKSGVARTSEFLTGVPKEAIERLIERPSQILGAESEGNALKVAGRARQELLERDKSEDEAISRARQQFKDKFGHQQVGTRPILDDQAAFLSKNAPTGEGIGPISPEEMGRLSDIEKNGLTSDAMVQPIKKVHRREWADAPPAEVSLIKPIFEHENAIGNTVGGYEQVGSAKTYAPAPLVKDEKYFTPDGSPYSAGKLPYRTAGDLQKTADYLGNEVKRFDQSKLPGTGDTRFQAYLRGLYGKVKGALHQLDPEGLAVADKQFTEYAQNAGRLGRLENEDQMEGFINNYFGKNKTLMRESAQNLIPGSVEDIADIGASRAFTRQGPAGSEMGGRRIMGSGLGAGLTAAGIATHNPLMEVGGIMSHLATSPEAHKAVIGNASKGMEWVASQPWFQAIQKNPQLVESISDPQLKGVVIKLLRDDSGQMPRAADNEAPKRDIAGAESYQHPEAAKQQFLQGP